MTTIKILKETEKAIRDYKLKGIMIGSSTNGEYLDSPRADAVFSRLVSDLDVPLFVHPPKFTIGNDKMEMFRLPEMLGRPFDTTLVADPFHLHRRIREISQAEDGLRPRRRRARDAAGTLRLRLRAEKRRQLRALGARCDDAAAGELHEATLLRHRLLSSRPRCNAPSTPSASIKSFSAATRRPCRSRLSEPWIRLSN